MLPMGKYEILTETTSLIFTAGMTPRVGGKLAFAGTVPKEINLSQANEAANLAAKRTLEAITAEYSISQVTPVHMTVYINCSPDFTELSSIADGASQVVFESFGTVPAREAVGVTSLPGGSPVEVSMIFAKTD